MPTSADAIQFIEQNLDRYDIFWKNTGRVSDDWKIKIYESRSRKIQFGVYDRKTVLVRVETEIPKLEGVSSRPTCPVSHGVAGSNFEEGSGRCYGVADLPALERLLSIYFFDETLTPAEQVDRQFFFAVETSRSDSTEERRRRLATAAVLPRRMSVQTTAFVRNPDVVAEVLYRATGECEQCGCPAPFVRASNGEPYLEVHHRQPLAQGGEDTVANAIAVCPNCHRRAHFA